MTSGSHLVSGDGLDFRLASRAHMIRDVKFQFSSIFVVNC